MRLTILMKVYSMLITFSINGRPESCMNLVNPLNPILKGIQLGFSITFQRLRGQDSLEKVKDS